MLVQSIPQVLALGLFGPSPLARTLGRSTTNVLERLFKEVKRRMRVVGVLPNETSAGTLATEIMLGSSEEWR